MTKNIDHADEARKVLEEVATGAGNLPIDWAGIFGNDQWVVSASYAEAQVHATLALVEQAKRVADTLEHVLVAGYDGLVVEVRS